MVNNDILKKLRVALKLTDDDIIKILDLVDFKVSKTELSAFFRSEDHPSYKECGDQILRNFLNGLVLQYRGTKENPVDNRPRPVSSRNYSDNDSRRSFDKKKDFKKPGQKRDFKSNDKKRSFSNSEKWKGNKKDDKTGDFKRSDKKPLGRRKDSSKEYVWFPKEEDHPKRKW